MIILLGLKEHNTMHIAQTFKYDLFIYSYLQHLLNVLFIG